MNMEIHELEEMSKVAFVHGPHIIADIPAVRDTIEECKEAFHETVENVKEAAADFVGKVSDGIKDYCCGVYEDVRDFLSPKHDEIHFAETNGLDEGTREQREFGLDKCTDAALDIFNPGVINEWGNLSQEQCKDIACLYADKVAEAFELEEYKGVVIEQLDPGVLGRNEGDGVVHLSETLIDRYQTPFEIMDTITHELRHQYQNECVRGFHDVGDEVRNEWTVATGIYNYDQPSCYDPWGYTYNPLEIDARYAGETVVRNVSSQMFNDVLAEA